MGKKPDSASKNKRSLPTRKEILEFIQSSSGKVGKREIARAFHIKGAERIALKQLLKEMANDGLLEGSRKEYRQPGTIADVTIIEIMGQDDEGDYFGRPTHWDEQEEGPAPLVLIGEPKKRRMHPAGVGDRVLAHIDKLSSNDDTYNYLAHPIKILPKDKRRLLGVYSKSDNGGEIQPIDKKQLKVWAVRQEDAGEAQTGDLVSFEIVSRGRFSAAKARIIERLGNADDEGLISLIAIESHGIPNRFNETVIKEVAKLPALDLKNRADLRDVPLITIDPEDARDHDDAVYAEYDTDPDNKGGYCVIVAIADVAFYVQPGSNLDKEALKRGNSVYFPDRVVPMLPEKISNDLCSLREGEERPALAVKLIFDKDGHKIRHEFMRAIIKSASKLSYKQAQSAIDGQADKKTAPLIEPILKPLWSAYKAVKKARDNRAPLELDLPERKIIMDDKGNIQDIKIPDRLEAHKLIEEFMIQANVAAAEILEKKKSPLIYRIHDAPSDEKLKSFKDFLATLKIKFASSGRLLPHSFNGILARVKGQDWQDLITEVVLRSQAQAEYSSLNIGHFGLNLKRYAHFTSPIRRYADLIVHRALISALKLGNDGLKMDQIDDIETIAEQISQHERRAVLAERETVDRLIASHLSQKIGSKFKGKISGVNRAGVFVRLDDTGADGFIPISTLNGDYFIHDEVSHALIGERTGITYHLGLRVDVRLVEIVPTAGAMRFEMLSDGVKGKPLGYKGRHNQKRSKKPQRRFFRK